LPRLVGCDHCHILIKMPDVLEGTPMIPARLQWTTGEDYVFKAEDGHPLMVPAFDPVLEDFVEKHSHGYSDDRVIGGLIKVWTIDQRTWDTVDVVTKVRTELKEMTGQWYEERNEYREAAVSCYNAHGNPTLENKCIDFMDDSKRIGAASWRDDNGGVHEIPNKFRQYLCHQCPYMQSYILVELRRRKGMYR
jgi:hypothetical protein